MLRLSTVILYDLAALRWWRQIAKEGGTGGAKIELSATPDGPICIDADHRHSLQPVGRSISHLSDLLTLNSLYFHHSRCSFVVFASSCSSYHFSVVFALCILQKRFKRTWLVWTCQMLRSVSTCYEHCNLQTEVTFFISDIWNIPYCFTSFVLISCLD